MTTRQVIIDIAQERTSGIADLLTAAHNLTVPLYLLYSSPFRVSCTHMTVRYIMPAVHSCMGVAGMIPHTHRLFLSRPTLTHTCANTSAARCRCCIDEMLTQYVSHLPQRLSSCPTPAPLSASSRATLLPCTTPETRPSVRRVCTHRIAFTPLLVFVAWLLAAITLD